MVSHVQLCACMYVCVLSVNSYMQDEWEREQEYFDRLEKKENIEEKLKSITELRVAVIQCKQVHVHVHVHSYSAQTQQQR